MYRPTRSPFFSQAGGPLIPGPLIPADKELEQLPTGELLRLIRGSASLAARKGGVRPPGGTRHGGFCTNNIDGAET